MVTWFPGKTSADQSIGMMTGAFFVGRKDILAWVNTFLKLDLAKVEQTANGKFAGRSLHSDAAQQQLRLALTAVALWTHLKLAPQAASLASFWTPCSQVRISVHISENSLSRLSRGRALTRCLPQNRQSADAQSQLGSPTGVRVRCKLQTASGELQQAEDRQGEVVLSSIQPSRQQQ
jgi:hypothetical protein